MVSEVFKGLLTGQVQDIRNVQAFVSCTKRGLVEASTFTDITGDIDICKEVHLNFDRASTGAGFATPPLDVEGESALLKARGPALFGSCEDFANHVPDFGVGRWITAGSSTNGLLVDVDDLVEVL